MTKTLIYIHIPKTGGATLQSVVTNNLKGRNILNIGTAPGKIGYSKFNTMIETQTEPIQCDGLIGHLQFGIHHYIDNKPVYITLLRDPVHRFLSQFYDIQIKGKRTINHLLRRTDLNIEQFDQMKHISIHDFLLSDIAFHFSNLQTRYLSGFKTTEPVTQEECRAAKFNLKEKFICFGLMEEFDSSLLLFQKILKWNDIRYIILNQTRKKYYIDTSKSIQNKIEIMNQYDMELYQYAAQLFEERIRQYGPSFKNDLTQFQHENMNYLNRIQFKIILLKNWGFLLKTMSRIKRRIKAIIH